MALHRWVSGMSVACLYLFEIDGGTNNHRQCSMIVPETMYGSLADKRFA